MKQLKKIIYLLILLLVVVSGLVFANRETKKEVKPSKKPLSAAEMKVRMVEDRKKWEASPDGLRYKAWEFSPEGKKVHESYAKIKKYIKAYTDMEAVVTSVTFQRENVKAVPKWLLVKIDGEIYMMQYVPSEFKQLSSLKVNDKIIIRSHSAGYSPNHPYLIVSGDYIAKDNKVLFKRVFNKNKGC